MKRRNIKDKRVISEKIETFSNSVFSNGIDAIEKWLKILKKEYAVYSYLWFEDDIKYSYGDEYTEYTLFGKRLETDKEIEARMEKRRKSLKTKRENKKLAEENKAIKERKEYERFIKERKEYERLKEKFDK